MFPLLTGTEIHFGRWKAALKITRKKYTGLAYSEWSMLLILRTSNHLNIKAIWRVDYEHDLK